MAAGFTVRSDLVRRGVEIDVGPALGAPRSAVLRGWAVSAASVSVASLPLLYCLAGGRCSTGYFDLHVDGRSDYSMAEHLASAGAVVVAMDHLGVGASDGIDDLFSIRPTDLARAHDVAFRAILARCLNGELLPHLPAPVDVFTVGVGHSMGGAVVGVQQATYGSFDALVLLGHGDGIPEVLTPEELTVHGPDLASIEPELIRLARLRFSEENRDRQRKPRDGTFFAEDVPDVVRTAFSQQSVPLLKTCGLFWMLPGAAHAERTAIAVPTFFGFGDQDLTHEYLATISSYPSLTELLLYVLPGSGHCHNQASGRHLLWDRILGWVRVVSSDAQSGVEC